MSMRIHRCQWYGCVTEAEKLVVLTDYRKPDLHLEVCELHACDAVEHLDRIKKSKERRGGAVLVGPLFAF